MADVFISHSSKDKVIADKMCEALEEKGLKCWIAPRDITPGTEWAVAISDAIATIKVMVVIYSANSAASTQVPKELGLADKRGKFIIPYKIDDMELTGAFDYYLAGAHWIVANPQASDYKFDELYGVMSGVMQVPLQNITNNTYIDKVTIEASVAKELIKQEKKSKKWLIPIGILSAALLVMVVWLVGVLMKPSEKEEPGVPNKVIEIEDSKINKEDESKENKEPSQDLVESSIQDFIYEIRDGEATIIKYRGSDSRVIIPSEIDGATVTYIAEDAFYQCTNLEAVEIPEGVVGIGAWAFSETNLKKVSIPASVKTIGREAFCCCRNLTEVELLNGVKEIGKAAFAETAIEDIILPDSVIVVGDFAFSNCTQLFSATLPNNLEKVADYMFDGCVNFQQTNIPESVRIIGEFAFSQTRFQNISLAESNIMQIGPGAFSECPDLNSVELPQNLCKLDEGAFQLCHNLETVVMPEGIKAVSGNTFYDDQNVKIIMGDKTYDYATYFVLVEELSRKLVTDFQYGVEEDGVHITKYTGNDEIVIVPDMIEGKEVTVIDQQAFANCDNILFLSIPYSIQKIEDNAFAECVSLNNIAGGELVTKLGAGVYRSTSILEAQIPEGQQEIGDAMFWGCSYLTSVELPDGLMSIGEAAFSECDNLIELRIPYTVEKIASNAFEGSENLTLFYKGYQYSYEERHKIPVMVEVAE